jgi:hypothetical protein
LSIPQTIRMASSTRSTPMPLTSAVSSACCHDSGTKEIAARLYTSSGCTLSTADTRLPWSIRSPSTKDRSDISLLMRDFRGFACPRISPHTW